ncbi:hypothetical protein [Sphingobium sp. YR768]|uniref:hypothetical protein n=1 Tax=Sphingobium sp. YR768 TaxID=1884365 RepID=UPI0008B80354|nr:hypothetical protein [Sphingobium sp. YR768]SES09009.1 hypothetical protein SAMN05518866_13765 [Sphingobium sp. YR768]
MSQYPNIVVQTANPDPTMAVNAFLWVMNRIRSLGIGIISLVQDQESVDDEDAFEVLEFIMARRKKRAQERRDAAPMKEGE